MSSTRVAAPPHRVDAGRFAYKAFISYSHAADGKLAEALQGALQRFAKPWHQRRAIRVFRDTTGLTVTPDLWDAIRDALEASEFFILLASERAAQSRWVELELESWLSFASPDRILIVWTDGELAWDHELGDFDWQRTTCLNPVLRGAFDAEPLHLDLRWARTSDDLSPRRPEFLDAVARLSSTLRDLPFDDLIGEEVRQHKRTKRLAASAITGLIVLLVSSIAAAVVAVQQRNAARRTLVDMTVASGVRDIERGDLAAAALWFAQALGFETNEAERERHRMRLHSALGAHPSLAHVWSVDTTVQGRWVTFGRDGRYLSSDGFDEAGAPRQTQPHVWDTQTGEAVTLRSGPSTDQRVLAFDATADVMRVLVSDESGTARLLDARSGNELRSFAHPEEVVSADFGRDGTLLLTVSNDNSVRIWNASNGQLLHTLPHESELLASFFTRDGQRVVSSAADGAHIWTIGTDAATPAHVVIPHQDSIELIDVSSDGRFVITVAQREARLWDLAADSVDEPVHVTTWSGVNHAEFSPDGSRVLTADEFGDATVYSVDPLDEVAIARHEGFVLHAGFSADGKSFATASSDRVARVWDTETGEPKTPPLHHEGTVTHVAFNADGSRLATATAEDLVRVWSLGVTAPSMKHEYVQRAEFHRDGRHLLTIGDFDVKLWDLQRDSAFTIAPGSQVYHAGFSPDHSRIVIASEDGRARIWDVNTRAEVMSLQHDLPVDYAAFHPSRPWLLTAGAAGQNSSQVTVWDLSTREKLFTLPDSQRAHYAVFNADGTRLLTRGAGGVSLWDVASRQRLPTDSLDDASHPSFSPDGKLFVVQLGLGSARVYDALRGLPVGPPIRNENYLIDDVTFGADSKTVLVRGGGYARLWSAHTGEPVTPPLRNADRSNVTDASMSADARTIATAASNGSVRLWDARNGQPLSGSFTHPNVSRVAFDDDAARIVTIGYSVRVWDLADAGADVPDDLSALRARVFAARHIDNTGALVPFDAPQFRAEWIRLQSATSRRR